ncbi:MAG: hypothetical protein R2848_17760 [Thermomicrobiales bacterium]
MNRYLKSIGGIGLVALLGVTMVGGVVDAQTNGTPGAGSTATGETTSKRDRFLSALAGNLGISVETLETAIGTTVDQVGFGPGPFGGRFRGMIRDRIDDRRERVLEHIDLTDGAAFLGITEDELRAGCKAARPPSRSPKSTARPRMRFALSWSSRQPSASTLVWLPMQRRRKPPRPARSSSRGSFRLQQRGGRAVTPSSHDSEVPSHRAPRLENLQRFPRFFQSFFSAMTEYSQARRTPYEGESAGERTRAHRRNRGFTQHKEAM